MSSTQSTPETFPDLTDPRTFAENMPHEAFARMRALPGMATTIGIVATDARLSKAQCNKLATMAHNGLARSIDPVHTMADGDTLFALATGSSGRAGEMTVLGALAATVMARAVLNAVRAAEGLRSPDLPAARDLGTA